MNKILISLFFLLAYPVLGQAPLLDAVISLNINKVIELRDSKEIKKTEIDEAIIELNAILTNPKTHQDISLSLAKLLVGTAIFLPASRCVYNAYKHNEDFSCRGKPLTLVYRFFKGFMGVVLAQSGTCQLPHQSLIAVSGALTTVGAYLIYQSLRELIADKTDNKRYLKALAIKGILQTIDSQGI